MSRTRQIARALLRPLFRRAVEPFVASHPGITARHIPYDIRYATYSDGTHDFVIPRAASTDAQTTQANRRVPPQQLWIGYGESADWYLESGRRHVADMFSALQRAGIEMAPGSRILDFGCGAGRMTRWLLERSRDWEIWGTDIGAERIRWCQENLSPPMNFLTNTSLPHLPFDDGRFRFIYARSVFTHITPELSDGWLLELRRVLSPGGFAYITVNDNKSLEILRNNPTFTAVRLAKLIAELERKTPIREPDFAVAWMGSTVLYDRDYVSAKLDRVFDIVSITEASLTNLPPDDQRFRGFQTAIILRRRD